MATQANFAATPRASSVLINTANTDTTGTGGGSFPAVFAAGANGSRIDSVKIKGIVAEGSTQGADAVRLWILTGGTKFFLAEVLIGAGAGPVGVAVGNVDAVVALGIPLPAGSTLLASTHLGTALGSYHVTAFGGDF